MASMRTAKFARSAGMVWETRWREMSLWLVTFADSRFAGRVMTMRGSTGTSAVPNARPNTKDIKVCLWVFSHADDFWLPFLNAFFSSSVDGLVICKEFLLNF